ncbi:MAG: polymer-forming cytoskeletal protein [Pseudomonadota bacterium]
MRNKRRFRPPRFTTVVGKGTVIRGDLMFSGGLHLDGQVLGNVVSEPDDHSATLTVSDVGRIKGDVRVANIILNGSVYGDVRATQRVELAEKARVSGKVHYRLLEMAIGSEVNGELLHLEEVQAPMAEKASEPASGKGGADRPSDEVDARQATKRPGQ